ncbi:MAG: CBS domain-containing protein [Candidatus Methanospirare jalkutatii]|nr:MAG: CBS domain-containing protein [Candidatus Methanospirare jalkutatii]
MRCCGSVVVLLWWCRGAASAVLEMEISAKDVLSERFVALSEEEMLSKAITVFEERSPEAIVVFDSNGTYKGVLSERWIYRARIDPRRTKVKSLTRGVPAVSEDTNIVEVARKMLESGVQAVPVFKASASALASASASASAASRTVEKCLGIVSDIRLLSAAAEKTPFGKEEVKKYATTNLIYLRPKDSVAKALATFREHAISRAPVLEGGKVVGIITMHDIVTRFLMPRERATFGDFAGEKLRPLSVPIEGVMSSPLISVPPEGKVKDAVSLMRENDISSVLIEERERCMGILTKRDLLEAFIKFSTVKERRRVEVQFAGDYDDIDAFQMSHIQSDLDVLAKKLAKIYEEGLLVVHFKRIKAGIEASEAGEASEEAGEHFNIRMRFITPQNVFSAQAEGFGALDVFERVKDSIERKVFEEKVLKREKRRKERGHEREP